ncbi:MAG: T9SS type A sorting domain-containing protein [candidate division Zixibacteria bacterium]|nr:T9SS type A sorting domain-containing protein [candidate division Zixibacteria bacterium]
MRKLLYYILIAVFSITTTCLAEWTPYTTNNSPLATNYISSLEISPDGKVLIGSHEHGLYITDGDNWSHFDKYNTEVPINFTNRIKFNADTLFIGSASGDLNDQPTGEGLSILNIADSTWSEFNMGLEINQIITGIEITHAYRAVSTYGGGLTIFDSDGWVRYQRDFRTEYTYADSQQQVFKVTPRTYIPTDYIRGLDYDFQNNVLWLATIEGAVSYNGELWQTYSVDNSGLPSNRIQLIKVDTNNGSIYFGTYGYGLVQKSGEDWNIYNTDNSPIVSDIIYSLEIRPDNGDLWIGADEGLNSVSSDSLWTAYIPPDSNLVWGDFYSDIAFDSSGYVWVSAFGGGIASKFILPESDEEDSLYVDVRKLKFLVRSPERNDITWLRAYLEPMVDLLDEDSVSITIDSESNRVYTMENCFELFHRIFHWGNRDFYAAYLNEAIILMTYYHNQDRIKLYLFDWGQQVDLDSTAYSLDVRIKLGSYVGYDQVVIGPVSLASDPDVDTLYSDDGEILLSNSYYPAICDIEDIEPPNMPKAFDVAGNYPNPFNAATRIQFNIAQPALVKLTVYDILGRLASVNQDYFEAGSHGFEWDGSTKASGVYYYTIQVDRKIHSGRMILLK